MVEFESINVSRLSHSIVRQLEKLILDGSLRPGDRLPAERDLAERLKVSRPSLREAIVVMESRGLLQSRRGGGTFVCDVVSHTLTDPLVHLMRSSAEASFDVLELRHALEEVAAYYAAERANEADRDEIKTRYRRLTTTFADPEHDLVAEAEAVAEFYLAISDASHNLALIHVMRGLYNLLRVDVTKNLENLSLEPENLVILRAQHEEIFNAIMVRNPSAARTAAHQRLAFIGATLRAALEDRKGRKRSPPRDGKSTSQSSP
jgi:GntR family transcriptional repressor for pyruvate dehydrogenase complex